MVRTVGKLGAVVGCFLVVSTVVPPVGVAATAREERLSDATLEWLALEDALVQLVSAGDVQQALGLDAVPIADERVSASDPTVAGTYCGKPFPASGSEPIRDLGQVDFAAPRVTVSLAVATWPSSAQLAAYRARLARAAKACRVHRTDDARATPTRLGKPLVPGAVELALTLKRQDQTIDLWNLAVHDGQLSADVVVEVDRTAGVGAEQVGALVRTVRQRLDAVVRRAEQENASITDGVKGEPLTAPTTAMLSEVSFGGEWKVAFEYELWTSTDGACRRVDTPYHTVTTWFGVDVRGSVKAELIQFESPGEAARSFRAIGRGSVGCRYPYEEELELTRIDEVVPRAGAHVRHFENTYHFDDGPSPYQVYVVDRGPTVVRFELRGAGPSLDEFAERLVDAVLADPAETSAEAMRGTTDHRRV